jgi:hypothetical protein
MIVISSDETDEFLANEHVEFSEEQLDFFKRAAPQNLYGLSKLMEYVTVQVGFPMGELTVFAVSAHIYEE